MANNSTVSLASIRLQAQQRIDRVNSQFISTTEWNNAINNSNKELYDILIQCYGSNMFVAPVYQFITTNTQFLYPLPNGTTVTSSDSGLIAAPFYKLAGVELLVNNAPVPLRFTLDSFPFTERNNYGVYNQQVYYGNTNLKYCLVDGYMMIAPIPSAGQIIDVWYVPEATNLQVNTTANGSSNILTVPSTTGLSVGMNVVDPTQALPSQNGTYLNGNTTIATIIDAHNLTINNGVVGMGFTNQLLSFYDDSTTMDGVSGWEEYIIIDAALKITTKEGSDPQVVPALMQAKAEMRVRIEAAAQNRDASVAPRVSDTQGLSGAFGLGSRRWYNW